MLNAVQGLGGIIEDAQSNLKWNDSTYVFVIIMSKAVVNIF